MKSFNFSKKFEQVTSLVLAIMLLLSVFTASNVAVFADSNNKSTKTKNSDSEVNLYVKSDVQPFIKSSSDSEYKIISKTNAEDDYYSAKVKKSSSASTADTANITYRLANFSVDNNKVYFIKPSNWNIDNYKIYAYVWDGANNFTKEMSVVKSTEKNNFYCEENNTLSHLNNADKNELYYADFSNNSNYKNYKNILFFANETGVVENNPQMKTDDFELNYGSVYFGNDKNYACKTIGNIKEVGSQFTATDDMIVSVQDNNISILKESDLNIDIVDSYHRVQLRNGIQISFWKYKSDVHFECSKYDTEKFGELTYYYTENNVEKIIDGGKLSEIIKNNDVNVIVKLGNIPLKIYTNVKVNTGLTIDSIKWNYKTNVNSHISGNNVYVPSSCEKFELAVDSLEITGAKLNGEKLEGEALKGINIIDKNISNSQTVYQKDKVENTVENTFECQIKEVKYLGETYKYPINDLYKFNFTDTVNSHFVDVSVTVDDNYGKYAFIDSENNYIYQNGSEKCKYIVTPTSNDIKTDEITVISNSGKISYEKGIITVQQGLTEDTEFTVKYPHEDGFEVKTYTIKPDNDAPEIESIVFTKKENDTLKNYGLYSSDEIEFKITIKDKDNVNVAGVDNEALSCADDYFEINPPEYNETDKTITYTCILNKSITSSDNKIFNKIFKVKDKVSNSAEYSLSDLIDKNNTKVSVGDEEIINESFEVVSNSNDKNIEVKNTFNGDNYDDEKHIIGSGKEVSVTSVISDKLSGINNIGNFKCTYSDGTSVNITDVSGKDLSGVDTVAYSYVDNGETTKTTEVELKYTIKTENSGKYELSYTVTNNSGVKKDVSETFYVDNTAPNVTNVDFVKTSNPSVSDQILNFLTFGIYSNDTIVMKVTATDSAPTSGLPNDTIKVKNGETEIKAIPPTDTAASNATQESNVTYSFELGNSAQAYKLSFNVKDNAGNTSDTVKLYDLVKKGKVVADEKTLTVEQLENVSDLFEVLSSNTDTFTFTDEFTGTDGEKYNAGEDIIRHGTEVKVTSKVEVSDLVGINNISNINCYYYADDSSGKSEVKVNADSIYDYSSETSKRTEAEINYKIPTAKTGKYELSYTATNNAGVAETNTKVFYVDNTAPLITKFTFESGSENVNSHVEKTDYGYYFKQDTNVKVTVVDAGTDDAVSGISEVHFYTVGVKETEHTNVQTQKESKKNVNSGDYTFKVPANFKGSVFAYAEDRAGNYYELDTTNNKDDARPVTPDKVIVENENLHKQLSNIDINLPSSNHIEGSNNLYNNDFNVTLNVSDSYSGIKSIEYSVTSDFDTDNNWNGSVSYNNSKVATTTLNGNGYASDWKIVANDSNIVTQASSTITVKNNSNNIKISVKLTDRAGNVSTKEQTLSIDKTNPAIKIEYDNNNHTSHNDTEFFKANRTATITVTERNFNPEDIDYKITNTDNVIPQISDWTKHAVAAGENPDGDTYTATIVYAADGDYTFDIAYTDMAGNKADTVAQHKFTIDKTIPVISVSFDNNSAKNNNYFKADRTATITVNEHNFNAADVKVNISATGADNSTSATAPSVSSWTNNGNVHTATISFAKDGKYAFDVNYTDLADNAAKENVVTTFYVDKTAPTVKISNVVNESANSGNVAPVISLSDNNYSGDYVLSLTRVDINAKKTDVTNDFASTVAPTNNIGAVVTYANFASEEVNDGIYVLNATLTDKAGNSSADTITFSVNRFGSTYMGGDEETNALLDNGYTNAEKDIVISEINVDKLTKSNISLSLDSSSLKTLKQNVDYTIQEDTKTGQWHRYNYTVKSSNFENEGNYTLELSSTDAAKNTSTNRIRPVEKRKLAVQFVVDKTSPVVNIAGIENNALYEENSKDVTIVCEDSYINPSSLVINLDNKTLKEGKDYTVEKDVASITAKIKVNATSDISSQNIKVSVKDMAQNSGDGSVENFTLSATVLMRFFANPVLVIISAVILAGIIVMVVLIVAKKRKNN